MNYCVQQLWTEATTVPVTSVWDAHRTLYAVGTYRKYGTTPEFSDLFGFIKLWNDNTEPSQIISCEDVDHINI